MLTLKRKTGSWIDMTLRPDAAVPPEVRAFLAGVVVQVKVLSVKAGGKVVVGVEAPDWLKIDRGPEHTVPAGGSPDDDGDPE